MTFNKSRLIFGGLIMACLVLGFSWWVNGIRAELAFVEKASVLTASELATLENEQPVLLTGIITPDSPRLYNNLVVGVQEQYYSGEDGGWEVEQDPEVRINLEIASGQVVPLFIDSPYPRGRYETLDFGTTRWKGYAAESLITSYAIVNQREPLLFEAIKHFGGTKDQYVNSLKSSRSSSRMLAAILLGICALVMFWPEGQAKEKRR
jgi:hypothetical protein